MSTGFDKHRDVGTCRRFATAIDIQKIQHEVVNLPPALWSNNRAPVHRETVSLFLKGYPPLMGIPEDPEQPPLQQCPYIKELLYELVPGSPGKCLLAALRPGGIVYPHTDASNEYFLHSIRVHIPVFTNEKVRFFCNGFFYSMPAGSAWAVNNLAKHAVINEHPAEPRVHLIFDVFPTEGASAILAEAEQVPGETDKRLFELLEAARKKRGMATQG